VDGLLHVLRQQPEQVRRAVGPLLEPPRAVRDGGVERRLPPRVGDVAGDLGGGRGDDPGRAQPATTSSASTIVYA
jgi:hypothetical protein